MDDSIRQFACIYCGRKLQIKGKCTYGSGRCPSCRHIIYIPQKYRLNETSSNKTVAENKADWLKPSDNQVSQTFLSDAFPTPDINDLLNWKIERILRTFLPSYDEITLFTLSFSFLLLFLISGKLREDIYNATTTVENGEIAAVILMAIAGMFLSFINIFFRVEKYDFEKYLMLFFAVVVTAATGIYSAAIVLNQSKGWLIIFPIWNIVNGFIMLVMLRDGVINTDCIVENEFSYLQFLLSIVSVAIILLLCYDVFNMDWAISYSICVCYTITINDAIHNIMGINKIEDCANQEAN